MPSPSTGETPIAAIVIVPQVASRQVASACRIPASRAALPERRAAHQAPKNKDHPEAIRCQNVVHAGIPAHGSRAFQLYMPKPMKIPKTVNSASCRAPPPAQIAPYQTRLTGALSPTPVSGYRAVIASGLIRRSPTSDGVLLCKRRTIREETKSQGLSFGVSARCFLPLRQPPR